MQIIVLVVLARVGLTVKFNVAMESQPATLVRLAVYVPAALMVCPFQEYGNWLVQIVVLVVLVSVAVTARFSVAMESQPAALVRLAVYVPAALMVCPFQEYGNWLEQMVVLMVLVSVGLTVKFNVATESHPAVLVRLAVYVPAALMDCPFQLYGNWLEQIVVLVVLVSVAVTTRFSVAMESQLAALVRLAV